MGQNFNTAGSAIDSSEACTFRYILPVRYAICAKLGGTGAPRRPATCCFVAVILLLLWCAVPAHGEEAQPLRAVHIGLMQSMVKSDKGFVVTLDNGVVGTVPLDHPVDRGFLGKVKIARYSFDTAVALLEYADGRFDWIGARLCVAVSGAVEVGEENVSLQKTSFATFLEKDALAAQAGNANSVHLYVFAEPIPASYSVYANSPFAAHNYAVLSDSFREGGRMDDQGFVNYNVDIAYKYLHDKGYVLYYVQKTRFIQESTE